MVLLHRYQAYNCLKMFWKTFVPRRVDELLPEVRARQRRSQRRRRRRDRFHGSHWAPVGTKAPGLVRLPTQQGYRE